jgi:hypothetical protein
LDSRKILEIPFVLSESQKLDAIKTLYPALIHQLEGFRSTMLKVFFGVNGFLLAVSGWIATKKELGVSDRIVISVGILIFWTATVFTIHLLKRDFLELAQAICRLDHLLGVYREKYYLNSGNLFPDRWKAFGEKNWREPIFIVGFWLVTVFALFSEAVIWLIK